MAMNSVTRICDDEQSYIDARHTLPGYTSTEEGDDVESNFDELLVAQVDAQKDPVHWHWHWRPIMGVCSLASGP